VVAASSVSVLSSRQHLVVQSSHVFSAQQIPPSPQSSSEHALVVANEQDV